MWLHLMPLSLGFLQSRLRPWTLNSVFS
ncbi:hypothetical protein CJF31_00010014 [Rutstroemia sp. NJR-2017a BVV2]|nr:hypothetical protein CJF31_00010014 [Rutstroemia sp. NJR-2017a BVV2]